jgi:hypothetical protein
LLRLLAAAACSRVARIPEGSTVLPAICTEEVIMLGAELEDGTVISSSAPFDSTLAAAAAAAADEFITLGAIDYRRFCPLLLNLLLLLLHTAARIPELMLLLLLPTAAVWRASLRAPQCCRPSALRRSSR